MHALLLWVGLLVFAVVPAGAETGTDPLPSWNDGVTKQSIIDYVTRVTKEGGPDYVAPKDRLATFDNDGTLWIEMPMYNQFVFAIDEVKKQANQHPEWKTKEPFKSVLAGDMKAVAAIGEKGMLEIVAATHSGMTTADFDETVRQWLATAKHPRFKVLYTDLIYQPMIELLAYLRANGFKTFIVSGGGVEFMRGFADPRASTISSDGGRSSPSAIPTATRRCWNGPRPASASASWGSCITPTRRANMPMIATPMSASSTRRSTRRLPKAGPWST
jgi:hypothetical protein